MRRWPGLNARAIVTPTLRRLYEDIVAISRATERT
jgi:hypothetical protein